MNDVVSPRVETYSGTFHQWLTSGVSSMRTLPTIWVHMWSVSRVSFHSSTTNSGQMFIPPRFPAPPPAKQSGEGSGGENRRGSVPVDAGAEDVAHGVDGAL